MQKTPYSHTQFAISLGAFICFSHLYLFQPMLPDLALHFGVSPTQSNWVFASATFALSLCLLPWAIASERFGRRQFMLFSLYSLPIVSLLMLTSSSILSLIILRAVLGFILSGYIAIASAYMAEEFPPSLFIAAMGAYVGANSLGGISGRIYGGLVSTHFSWQWAVLSLGFFSLLGAFYVHRNLPKQENFTPSTSNTYQEIRTALLHLKNPPLLLTMLIGGLNFAIFVNLYSVMGFRLTQEPFNLPTSLTSFIFLCYFTGTISAQLTGRWRKYYRATHGMFVGSMISIIGMFMTLNNHLVIIIIGLLFISFGAFFTHAMAYGWVGQHVKKARASASALYLIHYYLGGSLGGFLLLKSWEHWHWHGVVVSALGLYIFLFLCIWRLNRTPAM